jgi:hypothetical protein
MPCVHECVQLRYDKTNKNYVHKQYSKEESDKKAWL